MPAHEIETRLRLRDEDILEETDIDVLVDWRRELEGYFATITEQLVASDQLPFMDERWVGRATAARRIMGRHIFMIIRRLTELGASPAKSVWSEAAAAQELRAELEALKKDAPANTLLSRDQQIAALQRKVENLENQLNIQRTSKKLERMRLANERNRSLAEAFMEMCRTELTRDQYLRIVMAAQAVIGPAEELP